MERPIIALITDFGDEDFFIGSLKGVIKTVNPSVDVIDITHRIPPFDVSAAGFVLFAAYRYFPSGSIFLAVVDPGVGSDRGILLVKTDKYRFVAPDNGLLSHILNEEPVEEIRIVTSDDYFLPDASRTFEARDKMAPVAAWLSRGVSIGEFGPPVSDCVKITHSRALRKESEIHGQVLYSDRFGNLITNIRSDMVASFSGGSKETGPVAITHISGKEIFGLAESYTSVPPGTPLLIEGSLGLLEIAVREGSAADFFHAGSGAAVKVSIEP